MPELPEVQTIVSGLKKVIVGKTIASVEILDEKRWQADESVVVKSKVTDVRRRAKTILIDLDNGHSLFIHLKMTGQLIFRQKASDSGLGTLDSSVAGGHPSKDWWANLPNKYTRVIFKFSDCSQLFFNDLRRFGWIRSSKSTDLKASQDKEYGVEPLSDQFTEEYLRSVIEKRPKANIKKILTDQSLIAGIGNIYADEALFHAGIRPDRIAATLKKADIKQLHHSIIKALELGLKHGGASDSDYVDSGGNRGEMQHHFQVYGRKGESCKLNGCQGIIEKIRLNGRGTHFCAKCQK
jgi:formamidopyrimidine-DNA glycosylase